MHQCTICECKASQENPLLSNWLLTGKPSDYFPGRPHFFAHYDFSSFRLAAQHATELRKDGNDIQLYLILVCSFCNEHF